MGKYKSFDGYHDNKGENTFISADGQVQQRPCPSVRYFGIEIEMEFADNVLPKSHGNPCDGCNRDCDDCDMDSDGGYGSLSQYIDNLCERVPNTYQDDFVLESDGSLSVGFEWISMACEKPYMLKLLNECHFLKQALSDSYEGGAGVHVHVSKPNLSRKDEREFNIRLATLIKRLQPLLRDDTRESSYAEWYNHSKRTTIENLIAGLVTGGDVVYNPDLNPLSHAYWKQFEDTACEENDIFHERYNCVNFDNHNTIEFRFFQYTQDTNTHQQYIEFVDWIMDLALNLTNEQVYHADFEGVDWLKYDLILPDTIVAVQTVTEYDIHKYFDPQKWVYYLESHLNRFTIANQISRVVQNGYNESVVYGRLPESCKKAIAELMLERYNKNRERFKESATRLGDCTGLSYAIDKTMYGFLLLMNSSSFDGCFEYRRLMNLSCAGLYTCIISFKHPEAYVYSTYGKDGWLYIASERMEWGSMRITNYEVDGGWISYIGR